MHRAVAARLSNPKISLFEALQVGGFEYENDNDANALDSEHITLGQRKNQLSRRVRLARQQKNGQKLPGHNHLPDKASSGGMAHQGGGGGNPNKVASSLGGSSTASTTIAGNKRPFVVAEGDGGLLEDPAAKMSDEIPSDEAEQTRLMAKNHPGYHPILLQQRLVPHTGSGAPNNSTLVNGYLVNQNFNQVGTSFPMQQPQQQVAIGGFGTVQGADALAVHPMYSSISVPPSSGQGSGNVLQQQGAGFVAAPQQQQQQQQQHVRDTTAANIVTNASSRSASLNASRSSPPQEQQAQPAGVTIASLSQSAASVGMSLEQLAVALRSSNNLAQILLSGGSTPTQAQQELAVSLYQNESRSMYQRCMLLAGYPSEVAQDERSPHHLQMAINAWQAEGQRLNALMTQQQGLMDPPLEANAPGSGPAGSTGASGGGGGSGSGGSSRSNDQGDSHDHGHQNQSNQSQEATQSSSAGCTEGCAFEGGRHIHRLEGKCGHKAILHNPSDGTAHIDFVVGNRVECYHGVEPLSNSSNDNSSSIKIWPSNYKCKDLSCEDKCKDAVLTSKSKDHKHSSSECLAAGDPKILDLDDIDLEGNEWNSDFANGETVLGLFKLGDTSSPVSNLAAGNSATPVEETAAD